MNCCHNCRWSHLSWRDRGKVAVCAALPVLTTLVIQVLGEMSRSKKIRNFCSSTKGRCIVIGTGLVWSVASGVIAIRRLGGALNRIGNVEREGSGGSIPRVVLAAGSEEGEVGTHTSVTNSLTPLGDSDSLVDREHAVTQEERIGRCIQRVAERAIESLYSQEESVVALALGQYKNSNDPLFPALEQQFPTVRAVSYKPVEARFVVKEESCVVAAICLEEVLSYFLIDQLDENVVVFKDPIDDSVVSWNREQFNQYASSVYYLYLA